LAPMADDRLVVGILGENGRIDTSSEELEDIADLTLRRCAQNEKKLRALDLSQTVFTHLFIAEFSNALRHNTELQELHLDGCNISDEGVRLLAQGLAHNTSHTMKALSLENNKIHCGGAGHLAKMMEARGSRWAQTFGGYRAPVCGPGLGLRYLSLKNNAIASVGSKSISNVLMKVDDSLELLNLQGNKVCDWGAGWLALAIRNHNVLLSLNLCGNPIGSDGIEELKGACQFAQASLVSARQGAEEADSVADENDFLPVVVGQRLATVYISEVPFENKAETAPVTCNGSRPIPSRPSSAYRPGSAYRRTGLGTARLNTSLGLVEPGAVTAKSERSAWSHGDDDSSEPSSQIHVSPPSPSDLAASHGYESAPHAPAPSDAASRSAGRVLPGERAVRAHEKDRSISLAGPSRWRRKPRDIPGVAVTQGRDPARRDAGVRGCGAAAVRGLRRARSTPSCKHGALLGPVPRHMERVVNAGTA